MARTLHDFLDQHREVVRVRLEDLVGSSPREVGAEIFVSSTEQWGTIGGGQLEYLAIDEARRMLRQGRETVQLDIPLGPDIGQCCGGRVRLGFQMLDATMRAAALKGQAEQAQDLPRVYIFGAGHVGRALASALALLPFQPIVIDSRAEELALLEADVEHRLSALPESEVRAARAGSIFLILTHDHALDFLLAREALLRGDALYVGMIGSKTKRGTFSHWLRREFGADADVMLEDFVCPIGAGGSRDKRPSVIAAMVAAELLILQDMRASIMLADHTA
nr:xanthine dehydrogenase accessory protein XdhC [uncultured Cohaesibacter sp.]